MAVGVAPRPRNKTGMDRGNMRSRGPRPGYGSCYTTSPGRYCRPRFRLHCKRAVAGTRMMHPLRSHQPNGATRSPPPDQSPSPPQSPDTTLKNSRHTISTAPAGWLRTRRAQAMYRRSDRLAGRVFLFFLQLDSRVFGGGWATLNHDSAFYTVHTQSGLTRRRIFAGLMELEGKKACPVSGGQQRPPRYHGLVACGD